VKRRREAAGLRRAGGRSVVLAAALTLLLLASAGAAGCGGSPSADVGPYLGTWQRVEAGAPSPDFTLTIAAEGDGASIAFANGANGMSETVAGTAGDGYLACTLPTGDELVSGTAPASPSAGVPAQVDLRLSLGGDGQLVVDLVLADGTLEPIWVYERAAGSASPGE
jgi:hypothetical protein